MSIVLQFLKILKQMIPVFKFIFENNSLIYNLDFKTIRAIGNFKLTSAYEFNKSVVSICSFNKSVIGRLHKLKLNNKIK